MSVECVDVRFTARFQRVRRRQSSGSFVSPRRPRRRAPSPAPRPKNPRSSTSSHPTARPRRDTPHGRAGSTHAISRAVLPREPRHIRVARDATRQDNPPPRTDHHRARVPSRVRSPRSRAAPRLRARERAAEYFPRARVSVTRARVSVTRARIARAPAVCRSTTRRKVKCARRPDVSRTFAIDAPARASNLTASSARDHRSTRRGSTTAIGDRSTARRRDRVTSARDRGGSGKTCNTRRAIASGVGD